VLDASKVIDLFYGSGGLLIGSSAMKNVMKLMEAATGLLIALAILLTVIGAFYR
jgi:hypothetical protein